MCNCCLLQMTKQILINTNTILKNQESEGGKTTVWHANVSYVVGDKVKKGNVTYICIKDNVSTGTNAPPNATYWEVVV